MFLKYENSLDSSSRVIIKLSNYNTYEDGTPCATVSNSNTLLMDTTVLNNRYQECSYVDEGVVVNPDVVINRGVTPANTKVYDNDKNIVAPTYVKQYEGSDQYMFIYTLYDLYKFTVGTTKTADVYLKRAIYFETAQSNYPKHSTSISSFDNTEIIYGNAGYVTGSSVSTKFRSLEAYVPSNFEATMTYKINGIPYSIKVPSDYYEFTGYEIDVASFNKIKYYFDFNTDSELYKYLNDPSNGIDTYVYINFIIMVDPFTAQRVPYIQDFSSTYNFIALT